VGYFSGRSSNAISTESCSIVTGKNSTSQQPVYNCGQWQKVLVLLLYIRKDFSIFSSPICLTYQQYLCHVDVCIELVTWVCFSCEQVHSHWQACLPIFCSLRYSFLFFKYKVFMQLSKYLSTCSNLALLLTNTQKNSHLFLTDDGQCGSVAVCTVSGTHHTLDGSILNPSAGFLKFISSSLIGVGNSNSFGCF
jgi:hypothetical protein